MQIFFITLTDNNLYTLIRYFICKLLVSGLFPQRESSKHLHLLSYVLCHQLSKRLKGLCLSVPLIRFIQRLDSKSTRNQQGYVQIGWLVYSDLLVMSSASFTFLAARHGPQQLWSPCVSHLKSIALLFFVFLTQVVVQE